MRRILSNRHRRRLLGLGVAIAAVAVAAAVPALTAAGQTPGKAEVAAGGPTAAVVVTDLSSSVTFTGHLATSTTRTVTNQRTGDGEPGEVVQETDTVAASSSPGEAVSVSLVAAAAQVGEPTTTTTEPPPTDPSTTTTTIPATTVPATTPIEPASTTTAELPPTDPATTTSSAPPTTTTTTPATTTPAGCAPADEQPPDTTVPDPATTTTTVDPAVTTTTTTAPEPDPECPTDTTDPRQPGAGGGGGVAPGGGGGAAGAVQPEAASDTASAGGGAGGGGDQTVTWITGAGETLEHGEVAFGVDGAPTILLYGDAPAWRDLSSESEAGADIEQLEAGLVMLGFASADDLTVDQTFDADTTAAVEAFQEAYAFEVDGTVELGDVLFLSGPVTVTASVQLGDAVGQGSEVLTAAASGRTVSLEVDPAEVTMLAAGTTVDVEVSGSIVSGTVVEIGRDATAAAEGEDPTVDVTVELTDPVAVAALPDGAESTITLTQESHADVLAVPAGALHAGLEGGVAVTVVNADGTHSEVSVTPGFESDGVVEIANGDLTEGDLVALG